MSTAGICPCGGHLKEMNHKVLGHSTATAWRDDISKDDLPVTIERLVCKSCGRDEVMAVYDKDGRLI